MNSIVRNISLLFLTSLIFSNTAVNFDVTMLGVKIANVTMAQRDTMYHDISAKKIIFSASTSDITSAFYSVDNYYEVIVNKETFQILSFYKKTSQPNLENLISTEYSNGIVKYSNSDIVIPQNAFNIFTLLSYLTSQNIQSIKNGFEIESEGELYTANLVESKHDMNTMHYEVLLDEKQCDSCKPVVENTDVFTWILFKSKTKRHIWIDTINKQIDKCVFDLGIITVTAKRKL
jgi:hypothetical protein